LFDSSSSSGNGGGGGGSTDGDDSDDGSSFGQWFLIAVGAAMVSSILIREEMREGFYAQKGDEHGEFRFGGSTLILLFDAHTIAWDEDLVRASRRPIETYVKMGTQIGRLRKALRKEQMDAMTPAVAGAAAAGVVPLSSSPSPTSPSLIHTATTDAARKEAALNDEGLMNDFPFTLQSNLTLVPREEDTITARGVPRFTRAKGDAAEAVGADTSSRRGSTIDSLLPSFLGGNDEESEGSLSPSSSHPAAAAASSPTATASSSSSPSPVAISMPHLQRDVSDLASPLPAPEVFQLVQYTEDAEREAAGESEEEEEEDDEHAEMEDVEMGESTALLSAPQVASAIAGSSPRSRSARHSSSMETLHPPAATAAASSHAATAASPSSAVAAAAAAAPTSPSPMRSNRRRSRGDGQRGEGDESAAADTAAAAAAAAMADADADDDSDNEDGGGHSAAADRRRTPKATDEVQQPKAKRKRRGSRK